MARDVIDQLSLDIDIKLDKSMPKTISNLANSIKQLNSAVSNVRGLQKYMDNLSKISAPSAKVPKQTAIGQVGQMPQPEYEEIQSNTSNLTQEVVELKNSFIAAADALATLTDELRKNSNEQNRNAKDTKKSANGWSKFVKSIGRIAMYRAIRSAIKAVTDAMREGLQNYAQYSDSANQAISNIQSSLGQLKNSLGVTLGYLAEAFAPVITMLSDALVKLIDNINLAMASILGKGTYSKAIKQNEDYAKSLDKASQKLLSFDKFEALSQGDDKKDPSQMFEEVTVPTELSTTAKLFQDLFGIVKEVFGLIKDVWETLQPIISALIEQLKPIFEVILGYVQGLIQNIRGIVKVIKAVVQVLTGDFKGAWRSIKDGFADMVNGIANMFVSLVNFIIDMFNVALKPIDWLAGLFGGNVEIPHVPKANIKFYADGGEFTKGTAFIAGEAGAEIVYNTQGGNGGVANIDQIREAEYLGTYQALLDYGAARGDLSSLNGMTVVLDGKKVGQLVAGDVIREGRRVGYLSATR